MPLKPRVMETPYASPYEQLYGNLDVPDRDIRTRSLGGQMAGDIGLSLAGQVPQTIAALAPLPGERFLKPMREELTEKQRRGRLGQDPEVEALIQMAAVGPARGAATEERLRGEATEAAMGRTSPRDVMRRREEAAKRVDRSLREGGFEIGRQRIAEKQRELKLLSQLAAYEDERAKERRRAIFGEKGILGPGLADIVGQARAGRAATGVDISRLTEGGMREEDAMIAANYFRNKARRERMLGLAATATPYVD
jgi:hypothetical protein